MTKAENKQRIRNEALNKIERLYHPKSTWKGDPYSDISYREEKEFEVECIMEWMYEELAKI